MPTESDDGTGSLESLRRYTWWSFASLVPLLVLFPPWLTAPDLVDRPELTVALTAAAAVVAAPIVPLLNAALQREPRRPGRLTIAGAALGLVVALALPWLAPTEVIAMWTFPAAGLLSVALMHLRFPLMATGAAVTVVVLTATAGAAAVLRGGPVGPNVTLAVVISVVLMSAGVGSWWIWRLGVRIDLARETEADLAVARERLRFAADLHDLQGHHLQVIVLKGELLTRLVGADDDAARREAGEVAAIARTALAETRDVVHGYRQAGLATEVGNAVAVLEAAGIGTTVTGDPAAVPAAHASLFGALMREGTTNILRHSTATTVHVEVGPRRLALVNDAPRAPDGRDGSGLASLRERFEVVGGEVGVHHDQDRFELKGTMP